MIALSKVAETTTTITFRWAPVPGAIGYRFTSETQPKPSHTWDPTVTAVKFAKGSSWYKVEALGVKDSGQYPSTPVPQPEPSTRRRLGALRYGSLPPPPGPERYDILPVSWWETHQFKDIPAPTKTLHYMSTVSVGGWGSGSFMNVTIEWARANNKILKTAAGQDVMNVAYGFPLGDMGDPAFQAETARMVAARLDATGLEGVFFDDMIFHHHALTGGPVPAKYPTQQAWMAANVSFAKGISERLRPRYYVAYNCGGWTSQPVPGIDVDKGDSDLLMYQNLAPYADGLFCEGYQTLLGSSGIRLAGAGWDKNFHEWQRLPAYCATQAVDFLGNAYMATQGMADYVLFALLMEADSEAVFMWDADGGNPWHQTYDTVRALGAPTGPKRTNGNRLERPHTGGVAWIDPTNGSCGIGSTVVQAGSSFVSRLLYTTRSRPQNVTSSIMGRMGPD